MSFFVECANFLKGRRRSEPDAENIIMTADSRGLQKTAGYLEKRGKLKFMNSWKKYWFVLEGKLLLFYGSKDDYDSLSPCRGSISLGPTSTVKPYSGVPLGFQITTRLTTITLRAETVSEQTKWMQAFVSALNQNQNTNKSPTKLNHFRYSSESVNKLADKNEELCSSAASSPNGKSPQDTPKARESPLIDRLQKLGARSYGSHFSGQSHILEGVKQARQKSFVQESVAEYNRRDISGAEINEKKNLRLSPTRKISHIYGNMSQESPTNSVHKVEEVVLEDEDYCVCTLGKDASEDEEIRTIKEEESVELKPNMLKLDLHTELNNKMRGTSDAKHPLKTKIFSETQNKGSKIEDKEQSKMNEHFHLKSNNDEYVENRHDLKNDDEKREQLAYQQVRSNPRHYENVEVVQGFYLHSNLNEKVSTENIDKTKPTIAKPIRDRKLKNIQNLFKEPVDQSPVNHDADFNKEQNMRYINTDTIHEPSVSNEVRHHVESKNLSNKTHVLGAFYQGKPMQNTLYHAEDKEGISTPTHAEHDEELKFNDKMNLQTEPKDRMSSNSEKTTRSESSDVMNNLQRIQMETHAKLLMQTDSKIESSMKHNNETQSPTYEEPEKERKLKNIVNLHTAPKDKTSKICELNGACSPKYPLRTENKNENLVKSKCMIPAPIYTEPDNQRKLKNNPNSPERPKNETSSNRERRNRDPMNALNTPEFPHIGGKPHNKEPMKPDTKKHLNDKPRERRTSENKFKKPVEHTYVEINVEGKFENTENIYAEPEDEFLKEHDNKEGQVWTDPSSGEIKKTKTDVKFHPLVKPKPETLLKHYDNSGDVYTEVTKEIKPKNFQKGHSDDEMTENDLYAEPNTELMKLVNKGNRTISTVDDLFKGHKTKDKQVWTDPNSVELKKTKTDVKFHSFVKPKPGTLLKHYDNSGHVYTEVTKETKPRNFQNDNSDNEMTDNDLYAEPNTELMKLVNLGDQTTSTVDDLFKGHKTKCEQVWTDPSSVEPKKTKTEVKFNSFVKPKPGTLLKHYDNSGHVYTEVTKETKPRNFQNDNSDNEMTDNDLYAEHTELMKLVNLGDQTTSTVDDLFKGHKTKCEQVWIDPSSVEPKKTKTEVKFNSFVKPKRGPLLKHYDNSGHVYTEVTKETTPRTFQNDQLEYEMTDNDLYAEPNTEWMKLVNLENQTTSTVDDLFKGQRTKVEQMRTDPSSVELEKTKTDAKFNSFVKPKPGPSLKHYNNSGHFYTEVTKETKPGNFQNEHSNNEMTDNDLYSAPNTELMKIVNLGNQTSSTVGDKGHMKKNEQVWTNPSSVELKNTNTDVKFQSFVKPKPESLLKHYDNSGHVYTEVTKEIKPKNLQNDQSDYRMTDNDLYAAPNTELVDLENETTSKTEELQCEMDLSEEAMDEFECDNDLYGSPTKLCISPSKLSSINEGPDETCPKNRQRKFQFPPPPKDEDSEIYAEPFSSVTSNNSGFKGRYIQNAEVELENEIYGGAMIENEDYQYIEKYPEYEEPEILCDNEIYAEPNIGFTKTRTTEKHEEVEYSSIPDEDEKADHFYSKLYNRNSDNINFYEDPDKLQVEKKKEKIEPAKPKKMNKNRRQHSEPFAKCFRIEETKKSEGFIQKFFKQGARKHGDKGDKCDGCLPDDDMDDTLVMLTEIQQLLEKKKKIIKAMAVQCRNSEAPRSLSKSEAADLDKIGRAKSYPFRSPDLLKGLNKYPTFNSGYPALNDEYSTVRDVRMKKGEDIYSEVVSDPRTSGDKKILPTRSAKFDALVYSNSSAND